MSEEKPSSKKLVKAEPPLTPTSYSVVSNTLEGPGGVIATRAEGSLHIGPLPSPTALREYQEISPAIVEAIVDAFEQQGRSRRSNESWIYKGGTIRSILGVIFAFLIAIAALGGGVYLVLQGHSIAGTIFGGFGLLGLVEAFLYGTSERRARSRKTAEEAEDEEDEEGEEESDKPSSE